MVASSRRLFILTKLSITTAQDRLVFFKYFFLEKEFSIDLKNSTLTRFLKIDRFL